MPLYYIHLYTPYITVPQTQLSKQKGEDKVLNDFNKCKQMLNTGLNAEYLYSTEFFLYSPSK